MSDIENLIQQTQALTAEVVKLTAEVNALRVTMQPKPVIPAPVPTPVTPPRPGTGPAPVAANHANNILNGGSGIPRVNITPEEQARRDARQRAITACNEASRASMMATMQRIVTPKPVMDDFLNDPAYVWPGYAIIEAAGGLNNNSQRPRPI